MCSTRLVELKEEVLRRTSITGTLSPPKVMCRASNLDPIVGHSLSSHHIRDSTPLSATLRCLLHRQYLKMLPVCAVSVSIQQDCTAAAAEQT